MALAYAVVFLFAVPSSLSMAQSPSADLTPGQKLEIKRNLQALGYLSNDQESDSVEAIVAALKDFADDQRVSLSFDLAEARVQLARTAAGFEDDVHLFVGEDQDQAAADYILSADGSRLVTVDVNSIVLRDVRTGRPISTFTVPSGPDSVDLSNDGRLVAYTLYGRVIVKSVDSRKLLLRAEHDEIDGSAVWIDDDGKSLVVAGKSGWIGVADLESRSLDVVVPARFSGDDLPGVRRIIQSRDSKLIAVEYADMVEVFERNTGKLRGTYASFGRWSLKDLLALSGSSFLASFSSPCFPWDHDLAERTVIAEVQLGDARMSANADNGDCEPMASRVEWLAANRHARVAAIGYKNPVDNPADWLLFKIYSLYFFTEDRDREVFARLVAEIARSQIAGGWVGLRWTLSWALQPKDRYVDLIDLSNFQLLKRQKIAHQVIAVAGKGQTGIIRERKQTSGLDEDLAYMLEDLSTSPGHRFPAFADLSGEKVVPLKWSRPLWRKELSTFLLRVSTNEILIGSDDIPSPSLTGYDKAPSLQILNLTTGDISQPSIKTNSNTGENGEPNIMPAGDNGLGNLAPSRAGGLRDLRSGKPGGKIKEVDQQGLVTEKAVITSQPSLEDFTTVETKWDAAGNTVVSTHEKTSKNASALAVLSIVDAASATERKRIELHPLTRERNKYLSNSPHHSLAEWGTISWMDRKAPLAITQDGKIAYAGFFEPAFSAFDLETGNIIGSFDTRLPPEHFGWEERRGPEEFRRWDKATQVNFAALYSIPRLLIPVPGNREVFALTDKSVMRFGMASTHPSLVFAVPNEIATGAISDDGNVLALGSSSGGIDLFDANNGTRLKHLSGHARAPTMLRFSPNGERLYSSGKDGTLKIWTVKDGRLLTTIFFFEGGEWLTISEAGFYSASPGGARNLLVRINQTSVMTASQFFQSLYRPDLVEELLDGDRLGKFTEAASRLSLRHILASGEAPLVKVEEAAQKSEKLVVRIKVEDRGGGIGRVEFRLNGRTVGTAQERGMQVLSPETELSLEREFLLDPGRNNLSIVAYNEAGRLASSPAEITVDAAGVTEGGRGRLHILAIAINRYQDPRLKLNYTEADARALGNTLRQIGPAVYDGVDVTTILNEEATIEHLDEVFSQLSWQIRPEDKFVFFLAGHGLTVDGRYYFLPQDFDESAGDRYEQDAIAQERIQSWVASIAARAKLLLYDTCESGSNARIATTEKSAAMDRLSYAIGESIIAASDADQPAQEGYKGHGLFTWAILDGLAHGDSDKNGHVEIFELANHVDAMVRKISRELNSGFEQRPRFKLISNFSLGFPQIVPETGSDIVREPTHVLRESINLYDLTIEEGTEVYVVQERGEMVVIGADGETLGEVPRSGLLMKKKLRRRHEPSPPNHCSQAELSEACKE